MQGWFPTTLGEGSQEPGINSCWWGTSGEQDSKQTNKCLEQESQPAGAISPPPPRFHSISSYKGPGAYRRGGGTRSRCGGCGGGHRTGPAQGPGGACHGGPKAPSLTGPCRAPPAGVGEGDHDPTPSRACHQHAPRPRTRRAPGACARARLTQTTAARGLARRLPRAARTRTRAARTPRGLLAARRRRLLVLHARSPAPRVASPRLASPAQRSPSPRGSRSPGGRGLGQGLAAAGGGRCCGPARAAPSPARAALLPPPPPAPTLRRPRRQPEMTPSCPGHSRESEAGWGEGSVRAHPGDGRPGQSQAAIRGPWSPGGLA